MSETDKKKVLKISPVACAAHVWVYEPDPGPKDTPSAFPKFKLTQVFDKKEVTPELEAWFSDLAKRHEELDGSKRTCPVRDGDRMKTKDGKKKDTFAGKILVKYSSQYKPDMVDTQKHHLPNGLRIFSGDMVRVAYSEREVNSGAVPGLFLRLSAVQLVEKRAMPHSTGSYAFDEIEGFTVDTWSHKAHGAEGALGDVEDDGEDHSNF